MGEPSVSKEETIANLKHSLRAFSDGTLPGADQPFFDHELEKKKAKVRHRALLLLDHRARSYEELRCRLLALDFEQPIVESVLLDLTESGLINDEEFAQEWVRQRSKIRGKSTKALDFELRDKGISAEIRNRALAQISSHDELATARLVASKRAARESKVPKTRAEYDKALRRIISALARRGFSQSISCTLARQVLDQRIQELESAEARL